MFSPDERYITIGELEQGVKFTYEDKYVMRLPNYCECYGEKSNAVDLDTGTMLWLDPKKWVDQETMKVEESEV